MNIHEVVSMVNFITHDIARIYTNNGFGCNIFVYYVVAYIRSELMINLNISTVKYISKRGLCFMNIYEI